MGIKISTPQVEKPVVEQEIANVEKPQGLQNQNALAVDQTSGASSSVEFSSELPGDPPKIGSVDPSLGAALTNRVDKNLETPKKINHISIDDYSNLNIDKIQATYPNIKVSKIGALLNLTNIETGEKKQFKSFDKLNIEKSFEELKSFAEANSNPSSEAKYVYNMTGEINPDNQLAVKTVELAFKEAIKTYASDAFPGADIDSPEFLMGMSVDFNNMNQTDKEQIERYVIQEFRGSDVGSQLNVDERDIKSILYNNKFLGNVQYDIQQEVDLKQIALADTDRKDTKEFGKFKKIQEDRIFKSFSEEERSRFYDIRDYRYHVNRLEQAKEEHGDLNENNKNKSIKIGPYQTMSYYDFVTSTNKVISKLESKLDGTLFTAEGAFATEEDKVEQEEITMGKMLEYILLDPESALDFRSTREKYKDIYDDQVLLAMENEKIGAKNKITIPKSLLAYDAFQDASGMLDSGAIVNTLKAAIIGGGETIEVTFNDLYKLGISSEVLKQGGILDENILGVDLEQMRGYNAWLEDKEEHIKFMTGAYNVLALEDLPEPDDGVVGSLVNFTRKTFEAFQTSDFYFGIDKSKVAEINRAMFGKADPREVLNSIKTTFDKYNEQNPNNPITLSKEQEEIFDQSISELVSSGLGGMVPFMLEMAVIGLATEGVGVIPQLGRAGRVITTLVKEEFKMGLAPSTPFELFVGATFAGGGMLADKIPIKAFSKYFTALRPLYKKVFQAGWVGAGSSKLNEFVQVFAGDLMGHTPWRTEFNNIYGDLLEGKEEAEKEFFSGLLVDGFIFGISGAAHMRNTDFQSMKRKKANLVELNNNINKEIKSIRDDLISIDGAFKDLDGQAFYDKLKEMDLSPELESRVKKLEAKIQMSHNLHNMIRYETEVVDFKEPVAFENKIVKPILTRLNNRINEYNKNNPDAKLEAPSITVEIIDGPQVKSKLGNASAKFVNIGNGKYKLIYDKAKFDAGKAIHEIQHVMDAEYLRRNPDAKESISETVKEMSPDLFSVDNIKTIGDAKSTSLVNLLMEQYPTMTRSEIMQLEYFPNLLELFSKPSNLFENPADASSFLGDLKAEFLTIKRSMKTGDKPHQIAEIRTVEDLFIEMSNLAKDLGKGNISQDAINFLENLSATPGAKDVVINEVVNEKKVIDNIINSARQELNSQNTSEKILKSKAQTKLEGENLRKEVIEKGELIGKDKDGNNMYKAAPSTVNKIAASQMSKAYAAAYPKDGLGLYGKYNFESIPRRYQEEIYLNLLEVVASYSKSYDGRGTIDGWINFAINKQFINACRKAGVFNQDVLTEGETSLEDMIDYKAADMSYETIGDRSTDVRDLPGVVIASDRLNTLEKFVPGFDATKATSDALTQISPSNVPKKYAETPAMIDIFTPLGIKKEKIVNEKGEIALTATELGKKDQAKIKEAVFTTDEQITAFWEMMPEGFVPYNEQQRADGSYINVSDDIAGTATGVIDRSRKQQSPLYVQDARIKDAAGLPGYRKITAEELTPEKIQEIRDFYNDPNVRNNATKIRNAMYRLSQSATNKIYEDYARDEMDDIGLADAIASGSTKQLMAMDIYTSVEETLGIKGIKGIDLKAQFKAFIDDDNSALDPNVRQAIIDYAIESITISKNGAGFSSLVKLEGGKTYEAFKGMDPDKRAAAQDRHTEMTIDFINSPFFSPDLNVSKSQGSDTDMLGGMFKYNDHKRTVGNVNSKNGLKVKNAYQNTKQIPKEVLEKNPELAEALKEWNESKSAFESANSDMLKNTNTNDLFEITKGGNGIEGEVIVLRDKNGVEFLWNPDGTSTYKQTGDAMEMVKGNSIEVKRSLIDKVYNKEVVRAARAYDHLYNLSLSLWYKNLPEAKKEAGAEYLFRHFQMTTNVTMSDRGLAPFVGGHLRGGLDLNKKKGEHMQDSSMNTFLKWKAITGGYYNKSWHDIISSEYVQLYTDKNLSDIMDKNIGRNNTGGMMKSLNMEPSKIYLYEKGKFADEVIGREILLSRNKDGYITGGRQELNSKDVVGAILEGKENTININLDRGVERLADGKFADLDNSQRGKNMAIARRKTAEVEQYAIDKGLNIVADGTGASYNATTKKAQKYKDAGYEVSMVFVNTSLKTSLERNANRAERSLDERVVKKTWASSDKNRKLYKKYFGKNYFELNNDNLRPGETPQEFIDKINAQFEKQGVKVAIMMAGGPGAGKSTVVEDLGLSVDKLIESQKQVNLNKNRTEVIETSIGDFDDNIAFTDCKVIATRGEERIELDAQEFNLRKESMEKEGYTMSYEQFDQDIGVESGAAWIKWTEDYKRIGKEDMFIMTARAAGSQQAIFNYLKEKGFEIPIDNIITTQGTEFAEGPLAGENKKAAEILNFYIGEYNGKQYNKINFTDDYIANTDAVKFVTNQLDITGEVYTTLAARDISGEFNKFIAESTGLDPDLIVDYSTAVKAGSKKDKFKMMPYSAEDFNGLLYATLAKGEKGEKQYEFYKETLLDPYERGIQAFETDMVAVNRRFKQIKKQAPKGLNDVVEGSVFTKQDAVRVFLWNQTGKKIPGLGEAQVNKLVQAVKNDPALEKFAGQVLEATGEGTYSEPTDAWNVGTITTDLLEMGNTVKRKRYLSEFLSNKDQIFSKDNLNKLRAQYGNKYVEALENTLQRMELGRNRIGSRSKTANRVLDYINNTNGVTMFFNTRSAVLQTISAANYVNWSFNNPLKASLAIANQGQYWKDFIELMNDDFLVNRRDGNKINISENEIAEAAAGESGIKGAMSYLLDKGYSLTKYADSFAIASGGATYYRNRINDLVKREGMSEADAKVQAREEWIKLARESQQSGDPSKISEQQSSDLGRLTLAFANTPMQYVRIQKRALQDIAAGRGDTKANFSKLLYYGFIQNALFNSLQQALFAADEDNIDEKTLDTIEGMIDSQLRGMGMFGNAVVMGKNVLEDVYKRSKRSRPEYIDAVWKIASIAPGINSKISKLKTTGYLVDNKIKELPGPISFGNPTLQAMTSATEAITNVPVERVRRKLKNLLDAMEEQRTFLESTAMVLGWPKWQIVDEDKDFLNTRRFEEERQKQRESFFGSGSVNKEVSKEKEKQRSKFF